MEGWQVRVLRQLSRCEPLPPLQGRLPRDADTKNDERKEGMMQNINYAEHAKQLTDGELNAVLKVYTDEQQRREFRMKYGDANERAVRIAQDRHDRLYGHNGSLSTF